MESARETGTTARFLLIPSRERPSLFPQPTNFINSWLFKKLFRCIRNETSRPLLITATRRLLFGVSILGLLWAHHRTRPNRDFLAVRFGCVA